MIIKGYLADQLRYRDEEEKRKSSDNKRPSNPRFLGESSPPFLPLHNGIRPPRLPLRRLPRNRLITSPKLRVSIVLTLRRRSLGFPITSFRSNISLPGTAVRSGVCAGAGAFAATAARQVEEATPGGLSVLETAARPDGAQDGLGAYEVALEHRGLEGGEGALENLDGFGDGGVHFAVVSTVAVLVLLYGWTVKRGWLTGQAIAVMC